VPGTYRIVMTGSSFAMGSLVERDRTFAALLPTELSRRTGRKVELYNEGLSWKTPQNVSLGFSDVLMEKPDLILWILTPWDMDGAANVPLDGESLSEAGTRWHTVRTVMQALRRDSLPTAFPVILNTIRTRWDNTESGDLLQHYLYESQSEYVKLFLTGPSAEFLKTTPDTKFQVSVGKFDDYAADVEVRAKAAGVPIVAVLVPNRAQAAMVSMGKWPAGFDPYRLDGEIHSIISRHGGTFIDILPDFRSIPNPEQYYYPIDGHLTAGGHRIIAQVLANELTSGPIAALRTTAKPTQVDEMSD
jgi:stress-induced morphogen